MKKIVSAVAMAALAASLATAEVAVTMNGRIRPYLFSTSIVDDGTDKKTTNTWMDMDGLGGFEDSIKFAFTSADGDAGLTFQTNVKAGPSSSKNGAFLTLNTFNVWTNVFGSQFKIGAGSWKDGLADGAYRVKKDVDAQNGEGIFFEAYKLGSAFKGSPSMFVDDIANQAGGSNSLAAFAEYPFKLGDVRVKLTAVAIDGDFDTVTDEDTTNKYAASWNARAQINLPKVFDSEIIFKKPATNINVIAFYAKPKMLPAVLDATVGGSYVMASGGNEKWNGTWDVDLRVRYDFSEQVKGLSLTYFGKLSSKDSDNTAQINKGIVGLAGKSGLGASVTDVNMLLWNNLSARYVINDKVAAILNVGLMNALKVDEGAKEYGINYNVTPGVQVFCSKAASLYAGVSINGCSKDKASELNVSVPAVFRVKL